MEIDVKNTGTRSGKETVLWYISDPSSSISRPMKELKFFEKKEIGAGQTKKFIFEIEPLRDLSYVDNQGNRILEGGKYIVRVYDKEIVLNLKD